MGPAGRRWERADVHLSASQRCVSCEEKFVYSTKEVYGTFLFMLTIKHCGRLEKCHSTYLYNFIQIYIELKKWDYLILPVTFSLNMSNCSAHLKF